MFPNDQPSPSPSASFELDGDFRAIRNGFVMALLFFLALSAVKTFDERLPLADAALWMPNWWMPQCLLWLMPQLEDHLHHHHHQMNHYSPAFQQRGLWGQVRGLYRLLRHDRRVLHNNDHERQSPE
jgi:hypothetical protein